MYRKDKKWEPAVVINKHKYPRSYLIDTGRSMLRRNSNHIRKSYNEGKQDYDSYDSSVTDANNDLDICDYGEQRSSVNVEINSTPGIIEPSNKTSTDNDETCIRAERERKVPSRYNDYVLY